MPLPTETLTYGADGNLKTDGRWTYTWDAAYRLIKMESIAFIQNVSPPLVAVNVPAKVIEFAYDGLSRRIRKKVTEGVSTIAVWEAYVYDGWNMVLSVKLNPAAGASQGRPQSAIASNVWAPDLGSQPFARQDWQAAGGVRGLVLANYFTGANGGGIHVPGMDPMGNVTSVTRLGVSYSAGESPGPYFRSEFVYDYDAFGKETRSSTLVTGLNPDSFPFHFSTKFTDGETGLVYYGYRFYDPANGRWPNRDPIGEDGGLNLYGMVGNDANNYWDYLGLALTSVDAAIEECMRNPTPQLRAACLEALRETLEITGQCTQKVNERLSSIPLPSPPPPPPSPAPTPPKPTPPPTSTGPPSAGPPSAGPPSAAPPMSSHELSRLTSDAAKKWIRGVEDKVPSKEDLLRLQEIARRAIEAGKQSNKTWEQSKRLERINQALKDYD